LSGPYRLPVDNLLCYLIKFPGFRYGHGPERNLWFVDEANLILIRENKNDAPGKD
jgi:hypothetical protein